MLKKVLHLTVVEVLLIAFTAVFFSPLTYAEENSLTYLESGLNDLVYDVSRSVVTIEASKPIYPNNYSGNLSEAIYTVLSTGLVYDSTGLIIGLAKSVIDRTNIKIKFEGEIVSAILIGVDYQTGIALLKAQRKIGQPFQPVHNSVCAGQMVLAIGNSFGIRAAPSIGFCAGHLTDGTMQFSASVSRSSEGGGLFTLNGQLMGVITEINGRDAEIGIAFPAYKIDEIVSYLLDHGDRNAGYIGVSTTEIEISPPIEVLLQTRINSIQQPNRILVHKGLLISKIIPNSPAAKAGLKENDLIFRANGNMITQPLELANYIKKTDPGTILNFDILRQNSAFAVRLPIGKYQILPAGVTSPISPNDVVTDSIIKEIENLKKTIFELETRLKQLN